MVKINNEENVLKVNVFEADEKAIIELVKKMAFENGSVTICFTGNRPASLPWKYNENCDMFREFRGKLKLFLTELVKVGANKFITGMAMGFDIIMAEIILELKEDYAIELEGAIPCLGQEDKWSYDYKKRYNDILSKLDTTTLVSKTRYYDGCYHKRNHYMVDNSDLVIAGSFTTSGGTVSTIEYAKKQGKPVVIFGK